VKTAGSIVAQLVHGSTVHNDAANVLNESRWQARAALERLGVGPERAGELLQRAEARFTATCKMCESPIEQMMLAAMAFMVVDGAECFPPAIHDVMSGDPWPNCPVVIVPQFVIARYRLDFLVSVDTGKEKFRIAVECDGAEHHSKADDREKDAARDEYLKHLGIRTYRASGKWIYQKNWRVADEIEAILREKRHA